MFDIPQMREKKARRTNMNKGTKISENKNSLSEVSMSREKWGNMLELAQRKASTSKEVFRS